MRHKLVLCCVVLGIVASSVSLMQPTVSAQTEMTDWITSTDLQHEYLPDRDTDQCQKEVWAIEKNAGMTYKNPAESDPHEMCVYHGKGFVYAYYGRTYGDPVLYNEMGIAIAFGNGLVQKILTPIDGSRTITLAAVPKSEDALMMVEASSYGHYIYTIQHLIDHLYYNDSIHQYQLRDLTAPISYDGTAIHATGYGLSENGRWLLVAAGSHSAIYRVDLTDNKIELVGKRAFFSNTIAYATADGFISNDGVYGGFAGMNTPFFILHITPDCLSAAINYNYDGETRLTNVVVSTPCKWRNLSSFVESFTDPSKVVGQNRNYQFFSMSSDGQSITYRDNSSWNYISYQPRPIVQYLAIGDSYASGEGDITIDGVDHYIAGTNIYGNYDQGIPRETCHLSTRSYSMRIAAAMELEKGIDMQSVACAGATTSDVLTATNQTSSYIDASYLGQSTQVLSISAPRLMGIANASTLQNDARQSYISGRVQQIELVKKAQPKYLTVMIGGNDLDFGGVISACAKNSLPSADETCEYAEGAGLKAEIKKIHDLYPKLLDFYGTLQEVSPKTTIYTIGYPQFMDEDNESCKQMLDLYSKPERKAIHEMIAYANAVIKNAAHDAGVKYVDISNALVGGQLCDTGTDMTGITDVLATSVYTEYMKSLTMSDSNIAKYLNIFPTGTLHDAALQIYLLERETDVANHIAYSPATALADVMQALSHPNALGHKAMYEAIRQVLGDDLLASTICNQYVSCPGGGNLGQPDVSRYVMGFALDANDKTVYVGLNGKVSVGHSDTSLGTIFGSLVKGATQQIIQVAVSNLPNALDNTQPIVVELHSQTVALGTMTRVGEAYELKTTLPQSVSVGRHVLHIKGYLTNGNAFDADSSVFVEGPLGDIDDDGLQNDVDTCAFGSATGVDKDADGIDDACDLAVTMFTNKTSETGITDVSVTADHEVLVASIQTSPLSTVSSNVAKIFDQLPVKNDMQSIQPSAIGQTEQNWLLSGIAVVAALTLLATVLAVRRKAKDS